MNEVSELRIALQELSELRRRVYSTTQLSTVSRACNTYVIFKIERVEKRGKMLIYMKLGGILYAEGRSLFGWLW